MSESLQEREVWIGLVGVSPKLGVDLLGNAKGAWVTVLAWAAEAAEYRSAVHEALDYYGLDLQGMEDVEPLAARMRRAVVDPELLKLASEVGATGYARFGRFHTYDEDEARDSLVHS